MIVGNTGRYCYIYEFFIKFITFNDILYLLLQLIKRKVLKKYFN